jgi:hypothetical protein
VSDSLRNVVGLNKALILGQYWATKDRESRAPG